MMWWPHFLNLNLQSEPGQLACCFIVHACMVEANVVATILYLRRSSKFQPSDTWKVLLDDAVAKVANRSVPWD